MAAVTVENESDRSFARPSVCPCAVGSVCARPLQPLEADGAEEEDGVEQNEPESQTAVQPPAVQMDTQDLRRGRT